MLLLAHLRETTAVVMVCADAAQYNLPIGPALAATLSEACNEGCR